MRPYTPRAPKGSAPIGVVARTPTSAASTLLSMLGMPCDAGLRPAASTSRSTYLASLSKRNAPNDLGRQVVEIEARAAHNKSRR